MNRYLIIFITAFAILSCSSPDLETSQNSTDTNVPVEEVIDGIVCYVSPMPFGGEEDSRSSLTFDATKGMVFSWTADDKLTVFPTSGNSGIFALNGEAGKPIASFNGGGFSLTKDALYYAFSMSQDTAPTEAEAGMAIDLTSISNIKVTYAGQKQSTDNNCEHLGKYDYMASLAKASDVDKARFNFVHLGVNLFMDITFPDGAKGMTFENVELYEAGKDEYRQPVRTINLTSGGSDPAAYAPAWNDPDMSGDPARFSLKLGDNGFTVGDSKTMKLFIAAPAFDFRSKTLVAHFNRKNKSDSDGKKDWFFTITGKNFVAGKSYWLKPTAQQCTQYNINVQLIQDWEKGNAVSQTRSAGDPGTTEKLDLPKYMYAYFINDGHVVQTATASGDQIAWTKTDDGNIYNYTGSWSFNSEAEKAPQGTQLALDNSYGTNPKVYIIASKTELTSLPTVTLGTSGTTEAELQTFTYTYSDQDFMKNLYSTPWAATAFTGELNSEYKDVRLYHVASKVDINWENTTSTALSGNVSVNNFQTSDLSFFKPSTGNTGKKADGTAATMTGSVSTSITTGTQWNGRAVFYLPQPSSATYNVTIGSGAAQNITFTPDATFTSWFRGLVTIK